MSNIYTYILVRKDLPPAVQAVQAAHAAMEMGYKATAPDTPTFLVMLSVNDKVELDYYASELDRYGFSYEMFDEPDYNLGHTALCTYPYEGRIRHLSNLPLYK
jgi:hypothetical protein